MTRRSEHTPQSSGPQAPVATRLTKPGWRDPRLVLGVLIVAFSVLGGAMLFARADDTTLVWGVRRALPIGTTLDAEDLESRRVKLPAADLGRYLGVKGAGPVGQVLRREVGAGELLPAAAVALDGGEVGVRVPLAVAVVDLPSSVQVGSEVDVWVTPRDEAAPADRVLSSVRVVAISRDRDSFAPETVRSVIVLVPGTLAESSLGVFLGDTAAGRVILTQPQPGTAR